MNTDDLLDEFLGRPKLSRSEPDAQTDEFVRPTKRDPLVQEFVRPTKRDPLVQEFVQTPVSKNTLEPVVTFDEQGSPVVSRKGYSPDDLVSDEFYQPIAEYMETRFGSQVLENNREEVVNKFLNNMRGFSGGNSVRAVNELSFLNSVESDKERETAAKAYAIYDGMESLFGETSVWEKVETIKDFTGSALLDPVNLISLGAGKLATSGGVRLASNVAQKAATKSMVKAVSSGTSKKVALDQAKKVFAGQTVAQQVKLTSDVAKREAIKSTVSQTVKQKLTSVGAKEIYATGAVDGVAAAVTDYMYQNAMIRTKVQDEYSSVQTGVAAISSIAVMGTIAGASQLGKRVQALGPEKFKVETKGADISELSSSIKEYLDKTPTSDFKKRPSRVKYTREGIELESADSDFFITMMLGDDEAGIKGLGHILEDQGFAWTKRDQDDTITQFLADVIQETDPQDFKETLRVFSDFTGVNIKELDGVTPARFAKVFKEKMSYQGSVFNAASQVSKRLGIDSSKVTLDDYLQFQITGKLPRGSKTLSERVGKGLVQRLGIPEGTISSTQNRLIRLLVTSPSTSALNVTGFAAASTMNSATDLALGVVNAGTQVMKAAVGKGTVKQAKEELMNALGNTRFKLANTLDPNTTVDMFKKYSTARPTSVRELARVLPGGVENMEKIADGFDPNLTLMGQNIDEGIGFLQDLSLVTAQDSYTKSIEFITQLDKGIRELYGESYQEFFKSPNYARRMQTREYALMELKAADETLSTIFSKPYKDPRTALGEFAGLIEDARNIPGLGMLLPFGRFFNNTVAFMADHSFISLTGRIFKTPVKSTYTSKELITRGTISLGAVWALSDKEMDLIEDGYFWSQEPQFDNTGAVIDEKYEFPYAAFKAAARIVAHHRRGEDVPRDTATDIVDTFFGQFTRNLDATGQGITDILETLASADGAEVTQVLGDTMSKIVSQTVSSGTRFIEPVNIAVGLARGDDFKVPDANQGSSVVRQSFKYMNQIIDALSGGEMEERYSPAQGSLQQQSSKSLSTVREVDMTDLERVYNMVGIPSYKAGLQVDSPEVKNRYSQLYNQLNQATAAALLDDPMWKEADLKTKQVIFGDFAKKNKARVIDFMQTGFGTGDIKASKIIDIEGVSSEKDLREALEELKIDRDLPALEYEELLSIEQYLKTRDELLKLKVLPE